MKYNVRNEPDDYLANLYLVDEVNQGAFTHYIKTGVTFRQWVRGYLNHKVRYRYKQWVELRKMWKKIEATVVLILFVLVIFSSCSTLSKTQRMERDMFNPKPTRTEKKQIKESGVNQDQQKIKMPKRR